MNDRDLKELSEILHKLKELKSVFTTNSRVRNTLENLSYELGNIIFRQTHPDDIKDSDFILKFMKNISQIKEIPDTVATKEWVRSLFAKTQRQHLDKYYHFEKEDK